MDTVVTADQMTADWFSNLLKRSGYPDTDITGVTGTSSTLAPPLFPAKGYLPMPDSVSESAVREALAKVEDPELHRDIISLDMVRDLQIDGSRVSMTLMLTTPACPLSGPFKESVETARLAVPVEP